ncbi:MAG TPA: hypothetical protein VLM41_03185 [Steroidobacteraceae bacterium]|nr:hypothetical protein [Steroidobacteraceae bacterium]
MLKALGIVLLVVLMLVGALMPLKYTARMRLPRRGSNAEPDVQKSVRKTDRP